MTRFVHVAWSNPNLRNLGEYIKSPLIFGHVRAASSGHNPFEDVAISTENCHPFKYGRWTFVHNGGIPQVCSIHFHTLLYDFFLHSYVS